MSLQKLIILLIALLGFTINTNAQVNAPDFQCVTNDTLVWQVPINTCGSFNSYDIFFSENVNGPYNLLTSITNAGETRFFHSNPGGNTWYYYMQSNNNCPGEPILSSDTLNNESPIIAPIQSVSVVGNSVVIIWEESPSPEVNAYIIYRTTSIGTVPIDVVFDTNTYTDLNALPNSQSELYYVVATDPCGNTSIFDLPHSTIFVEAAVDPCEQIATLNWNSYQNWPNGIDRQEIWLSIDGSTPIAIDTVGAVDTSYIYQNLNDGTDYCFVVQAFQNGSSIGAASNEICFTTDIVQPMRNMVLKNVSVDENNQVDLFWRWETNAEINNVSIVRSNEQANYAEVFSYPPTFPLNSNNTFLDNTIDASLGKVFYKIRTTDDCDTLAFSNYASTIYLDGSPNSNLTNEVRWTAFDIVDATVQSYDLYRVVAGDEDFLATLPMDERTYTDPVDLTQEAEANVCYYVIANATYHHADGTNEPIKSRSNIFCVEQLTNLYVPNAFSPSGINNEFRPVVVFGTNVNYEMIIYNRWGQQVFQSNEILNGWNGKLNNKEQPQGVYAYFIRMTQTNGRVIERTGNVVLLW